MDNNNSNDNEAQSMLVSMGFAADQAAAALRECGGNLEHAANLLLSGNAPAVAAGVAPTANKNTTTTTPSVMMIHGALHQYNVDNGKSACTCIALTAAQLFLQQAASGTTAVDATFLQNAVWQGVEKYNAVMRMRLHQKTNGTSTVAPGEHLSAEEVLQTGTFPALALDAGGVVQGLLSPPHGPLSLHALLTASQLPSTWTAVLIIKPPETVLCCLPPTTSSSSNANNNNNNNNNNNKDAPRRPFLLVDSHPRPQQFGATGSYVRQHDTLSALVESLHALFPATELGPNVPEWMGAAYNSFDLYRLRLASS